jgi:predicted TIM-barrel fold metal-dependent hydrolase
VSADRIDVHQHVLPPFWIDGLKARHSVHRPPAWTPEAAIAYMDSRDITKGILSLTAPAVSDWAENERPEIARDVNDYTAKLVERWPDRFGNFATLPLPDMDAALRELAYAFDTLAADGVVLLSNYGDRYLGDRCFEPLWSELNRREAVVFIHPTRSTLRELTGIPAPFLDFPCDTARTANDLVLSGVLDRYRSMHVILSHAGGFVPYAVQRFAACAALMPGAAAADAIVESFRRFYFDTALSSSPFTIPSLKAFADPTRIVFGSDFPYGPGGAAEQFTAMLDASALLSATDRAAINRTNAQPLFETRVLKDRARQ